MDYQTKKQGIQNKKTVTTGESNSGQKKWASHYNNEGEAKNNPL